MTRLMLRIIRATQPVSRVELATRLGIHRSTVTDICKPLIAQGFLREEQITDEGKVRQQGRPRIGLTFRSENELFGGVSIGVKKTQDGMTTLGGEILGEVEFDTPQEPKTALRQIKQTIERLRSSAPEDRRLKIVGVSVPGVTCTERRKLLYAPRLDWKNIDISEMLEFDAGENIPVIVENDAAAAAMFEARVQLGKTTGVLLNDFVLVRSGTGIGVGLVLDGEVYRGTGKIEGFAGEFGHMTIVAGGKHCVCSNRGGWEQYASASSATSLYLGDRAGQSGQPQLRFLDIVAKTEVGDIRARRTLERIGEYHGIGIANLITGIGIPRIIISGRLVYGWKFINRRLLEVVEQSMAGKIKGWSVEPGEPRGSTSAARSKWRQMNNMINGLGAYYRSEFVERVSPVASCGAKNDRAGQRENHQHRALALVSRMNHRSGLHGFKIGSRRFDQSAG